MLRPTESIQITKGYKDALEALVEVKWRSGQKEEAAEMASYLKFLTNSTTNTIWDKYQFYKALIEAKKGKKWGKFLKNCFSINILEGKIRPENLTK